MHYVDRGAEPTGLKRYRDRYTPRWASHYERGIGTKPSDSHWRIFLGDIGVKFSNNCGYCETLCKGEVDHFRPKSRFPKLVYEWSNWIFSCHDCNSWKREKWPNSGYIDPCAKIERLRPEKFFDFDLKTGEIIPRKRLTPYHQKKMKTMIDDFHLNDFHHLKARWIWITMVSELLRSESKDDPGHVNFLHIVSSRDCQFSSITRALLAKRGYSANTS